MGYRCTDQEWIDREKIVTIYGTEIHKLYAPACKITDIDTDIHDFYTLLWEYDSHDIKFPEYPARSQSFDAEGRII